jgi:hypothetical protein
MDVRVQFICDRQDLLQNTLARRLGLESYIFDRLDMYWIYVAHTTGTAAYVVQPAEDGSWELCEQPGRNTPEAHEAACLRFKGSEEEANQARWVRTLEVGGYFSDGRYPGSDTEECPRCSFQFKRGSKHEHELFEGRVIPHSNRLYRDQLAAGLKPRWHPGGPDGPSLEELGV